MALVARLRNYFNAQFEAVKGETRIQTAQLHAAHIEQLAAGDQRSAERTAALSARLDDLDDRVDALTAAVVELRATNDRLLAVAAALAERDGAERDTAERDTAERGPAGDDTAASAAS